MATYYWTGAVNSGTGTWDASDTANWSASSGGAGGAGPPTSADSVIFDALSGSGTVTIASGATAATFAASAYTGTLAFTASPTIAGNATVIFVGGAGYSVSGTPAINCTYAGATGTRVIMGSGATAANAISALISAGTDSVQFSGVMRTIDFTGFSGNLVASASHSFAGDYVISTGMSFSGSGANVTAAATSGTQTFTGAGKTLPFNLAVDAPGAILRPGDALIIDVARFVSLTNGTLDLNGLLLTAGAFSSTNSNTRAIVVNGGSMTITANNGTIWNSFTATGLTITGTLNVTCNYSGSTGTRTIAHGPTGATQANSPNFLITAGTDTVTTTSNTAFGTLDFTGFAGTLGNIGRRIYGNLTYSTGMTLSAGTGVLSFLSTSGTSTVTSNGKTQDFPVTVNAPGATVAFADALTLGSTRAFTLTAGTVQLKDGVTTTVGGFATGGALQRFLQSTTPGAQATLSDASGTNSLINTTIQDIAATGGAVWNAPLNRGNVDAGNNSGINFIPQGEAGSRAAISLGLSLSL